MSLSSCNLKWDYFHFIQRPCYSQPNTDAYTIAKEPEVGQLVIKSWTDEIHGVGRALLSRQQETGCPQEARMEGTHQERGAF